MSQKLNIIFVDDEPKLLQGLQRMLHNCRDAWSMHFVASGKEALKLMEQRSFDVIVSDMRMPEMDGAELLRNVQQRYPDTARIVLSGQSEEELVMKVIGPAHQYLSKPCTSEHLKKTVEKTVFLRTFMKSEKLATFVNSLSSLPSMPPSQELLAKELEEEIPSISRISSIIAKDPAMSAKVLQLVNSEFFGLATRIATINEAVHYLGLDTLRSLLVGIDVFSEIPDEEELVIAPTSIWTHSLITAIYAKQIALSEQLKAEQADEAFTAGMLHDLGLLVFSLNFPEELKELKSRLSREQREIDLLEEEIFETSHAAVGAYLAGLWGLPDSIVEAILLHHQPGKSRSSGFSSTTAVHVADHFAQRSGLNPLPGSTYTNLDYDYLDQQGLKDHVDNWRVLCQITHEEALYEELRDILK